jgi:hypothetical protein
MKFFSNPLVKRKIVCVLLGIIFGFVCFGFAESNMEEGTLWNTPNMWGILFNRILIGIVVYLGGVLTYNKILKFRIYPWFRGASLGAIVSIDLAVWSLMTPNMDKSHAWAIFGMTIVMGAIYGSIIDIVATKIGGEGKEIIEGWTKE